MFLSFFVFCLFLSFSFCLFVFSSFCIFCLFCLLYFFSSSFFFFFFLSFLLLSFLCLKKYLTLTRTRCPLSGLRFDNFHHSCLGFHCLLDWPLFHHYKLSQFIILTTHLYYACHHLHQVPPLTSLARPTAEQERYDDCDDDYILY